LTYWSTSGTRLIKYKLKSCSTVGLLAWLVLAQSTRWATPWATWISWAMFGGLVVGWLARRKGAALLAVWRSPLLPITGAAVLSAAVNGGWPRALDWCMYACMWAWMDDAKPRLSGAIGTVGKMVIAVSVFEWFYLVRTFGGGRVHLLGNSNVIAAMIALAMPRLRGWWLLLAAAAMVATGSLAGLIGLGLWFVSTWKGNHKGLPLLAGVVGVGLAVFIRPESAMLRLAFWQQAIRLFLAHPLAGVGPGLYRYGEWVHAHNSLATILAEMGTIGLSGLGLAAWRTRRVQAHTWARILGPMIAVIPFFLIDDMAMWWAVMLGVIYATTERDT
jgi:hypothetical protein